MHITLDIPGLEEGQPMRGSALVEGFKVINGQRQDAYGNPEDSFKRIAHFWTAYMHSAGAPFVFTDADIANMMILLKIARALGGSGSLDNYIDIAGYAGLAADMTGESNE